MIRFIGFCFSSIFVHFKQKITFDHHKNKTNERFYFCCCYFEVTQVHSTMMFSTRIALWLFIVRSIFVLHLTSSARKRFSAIFIFPCPSRVCVSALMMFDVFGVAFTRLFARAFQPYSICTHSLQYATNRL